MALELEATSREKEHTQAEVRVYEESTADRDFALVMALTPGKPPGPALIFILGLSFKRGRTALIGA